MSNKLRFERAIAKAIETLLEELSERPDDYEKQDFRELARALSKPPREAMQLIGREVMKIYGLNPLGTHFKDSWESVNWEQVARTLDPTILKFLTVASMRLGEARAHR